MEQRTHETNPQPLDTALNESSMTFALQRKWKGDEAEGGDRHIDRDWVTHEMGSAFATPPARSPTEMLYSMVLSTGPSSFQIAAWATGVGAVDLDGVLCGRGRHRDQICGGFRGRLLD